MMKEKTETYSYEKGLPEYLRPFFWDVDFRNLSVKDSSYFIISRLMEHGDEAEMRFLLKTYNQNEMIHVLKTGRSLSRRSREFWKIFFPLFKHLTFPFQSSFSLPLTLAPCIQIV